ncbi:fdxN element excision controlling factor protein [Trichormus variabilis ATCC 29413]|uniref:FdxN element excision controlling factor protein n=2 Tax=Anabaena variabilis TaxID=264691 RepID=Q3M7W5_TRIV2|nr:MULTISPECIES: XisI protein [Nostocaceae]ABA22921.1 fdxN element excision controlling factor protein [Trichormus variabilis ATCC 29413]MBC1216753.1 XisI protein [Trichormus variabilis ARAD]MBC1258777.1 XisI protein [Trichormus variabilis V5]MBC1269358.1 XisI protein [Trichormus variabilis FSR]MBC1304997.1 XisI protein [Trichormus variabilis N2B]
MDKLTHYRQLVQNILNDYGEQKPSHSNIEVETIFDKERDHYQIVNVGWEGQNWVHSCIIHIDIKCEKIWLQWNSTEDDIAANLVAAGVPKKDIVLGFQSPFMRQFTDYAVS